MENPRPMDRRYDRAMGAMLGVAIGDAMGMPTQTLTRGQILRIYGRVTGFRDAMPEQPVSAGLAAGTITDDTEQSLLLARLLIDGHGRIDEDRWAKALLDWEQSTKARGLNDLLGPSTKRAIDALLRGVAPSETGRLGTTNGAAMRIAPVAITVTPEPLARLVDAVEQACRITHNTSEAIASASAVAATVSVGIEGASLTEAISLGLAAARLGETRGTPATAGSMAERITGALKLAENAGGPASAESLAARIGTSVAAIESVPMAFAILKLSAGDAWTAAVLSANIGDDTDTIGAIACGMAGACSGASSLPADAVATVTTVNALDLSPLVQALLQIRCECRP